jgi:hypothetical protein
MVVMTMVIMIMIMMMMIMIMITISIFKYTVHLTTESCVQFLTTYVV